jgi:drug/metabolite transporter (DMT)-like permease
VPLLPGVCYVFGWLVLYISLFFISAKMGEVLIGCFIISTALLSKFVLKKLFAKTAVLGCVLVFCGFTLI